MYLIRKAEVADKEKVNRAHVYSIKEICSKDYTPLQIDRWSDLKYSDDIWSNTVLNDCCYVLEEKDNSEIHGFCHAKIHPDGRGEIVGLYFTSDVVGKGMGREIFLKCLEYLKAHQARVIFLIGTKTAKGFYQKMGFEIIYKKVAQIRGVEIECFYMELNIVT